MEDLVLYFSLKYEGDFEKIYKALLHKERINEALKHDLFRKLEESKIQYTTIFSDDYPKCLKSIACPPFVLYYQGNLRLINEKTICVVGTRKPTDYGIRVTKKITQELIDNNYVIVNGVGEGVEYTAIETVMNSNGRAIGVVGNGIETFYPKCNNKAETYLKKNLNGLIISEIPFDKKVSKKNLDFRKRLISSLSDEILITEAKENSDVMKNVYFGLEQGKDVYCVSSQYDSEFNGCNRLIEQGAYIYMGIDSLK